MPRVSVVIPIYNAASTVARAIDSVLRQTLQDFEIIVVDDGSTDDVQQVLERYGDRVFYIYQEHRGCSAARNRGISEARGEYIAFLDADDWWLPAKLEKQVEALSLDATVGLVHAGYYLCGVDGRILRAIHPWPGNDPGSNVFDQLLFRQFIGSPTFVMVRTAICQELGGFDESMAGGEDWDLWLRLALRCKVAYINEPLACYQMQTGDIAQRMASRRTSEAWLHMIDKLFDQIEVQQCYGHLLVHARAVAFVRAALLDLSVGNVADARERLRHGISANPQLFMPPLKEIFDLIAETATKWGQQSIPISHSLAMVDQFYDILPAPQRTLLSAYKRKLKARLCAVQFYSAHARKDRRSMQLLGAYTIVQDVSWLSNRGFVSLWMRQFLGNRVFELLRTPFKRQ